MTAFYKTSITHDSLLENTCKHSRIISLRGNVLWTIKLFYFRHLLMKCQYQGRRVIGHVFVY